MSDEAGGIEWDIKKQIQAIRTRMIEDITIIEKELYKLKEKLYSDDPILYSMREIDQFRLTLNMVATDLVVIKNLQKFVEQ